MLRTLGIAGLLLTCGSLVAQDRVSYKSRHELSWPVPAAFFELNPKPTKFRLYSSSDRGPFQLANELGLDELQRLRDRREGFLYTAKGDGVEDFAVQLVYANGDLQPTTDRLRADYRIVFDTRPPVVNAASEDRWTVAWTIQDENLDADATRLECRWVNGDPNWHAVPRPRGGFAAKDRYTWERLSQEDRTLEVRVIGKDKAGHETASRIVRLNSGGNASGNGGGTVGGNLDRFDRDEFTPRAQPIGRLRENFSGELPGQPKILYMDKRDLKIKPKLNTITRSGVSKLHLFFKDLTRDPNGEWKLAGSPPVSIPYQTTTPKLDDIGYLTPDDGRYGFIIIPESGAGIREPNPRNTAQPQHLVEVDTVPPKVAITQVTPMTGGATGTKLDIQWDAKDLNMVPDNPILLEYADTPTAAKWMTIASGLPNSRRYTWEVPQSTPYKFFVRVRATDQAGNVGEKITDKDVVIDLDKPSAVIEDVRTNGGPANNPPPTPAVTTGASPAPMGTAVPSTLAVPDKLPNQR